MRQIRPFSPPRRAFLHAAAASTVFLVKPSLVRGTQANSTLAIGVIGAGDRGSAHLKQLAGLAQQHQVKVTAICDIWQVNLQKAAERVTKAFGAAPRVFTRFDDLIANGHVDAVVIATPDYAHTPMLIAALTAGKDAYVEKPMSIDLAEANRALDLARAGNRIVQVGTQYRSHGGYTAAARELASGVLGKIHRIHAAANFNQPRWARPYADCKEADVDWQAFLFNRQPRPFDPRLLRRWQLYRDFTNGLPGLWMSHYVDAVHLMTGASYPASAVSAGGVYVWHDGREHADTFQTLLEYPEGFLFDWSMSLGNQSGTAFEVFGTKATLDVGSNYATPDRLAISADGPGRRDSDSAQQIVADTNQDHLANWLTCLRTRERPNADIQFGHQHAVATIMAAKALETGRRQKYDPHKREICAG
jgi:predicted dehydrogenase